MICIILSRRRQWHTLISPPGDIKFPGRRRRRLSQLARQVKCCSPLAVLPYCAPSHATNTPLRQSIVTRASLSTSTPQVTWPRCRPYHGPNTHRFSELHSIQGHLGLATKHRNFSTLLYPMRDLLSNQPKLHTMAKKAIISTPPNGNLSCGKKLCIHACCLVMT